MTHLSKDIKTEAMQFNEFVATLYPKDEPNKIPKFQLETIDGKLTSIITTNQDLIAFVKKFGLTEHD